MAVFKISSLPVTLEILPVPFKFSLDRDRFYICLNQGEKSYTFPLQFKSKEISHFAREFKGFDLRLDEDGKPLDLARIQYWLNNQFLLF